MGTAAFDQAPEAPLGGLRVIDLSATAAGALATQFLADGGAEVIHVEPPGGSPLRRTPGWPALARGTRSLVLDLHAGTGRQRLNELLKTADVLVTTFRPETSARLGLTADALAEINPRLVSAAITGWGGSGPLAHLKGYEGMVMAKLGIFHAKKRINRRPGPAFVSVPYASWGAAHTALQGILSALLDREFTGLGQHVEADLVRGIAMLDTWTWFTEMVGLRWPDAYQTVDGFTEDGEPQAHLVYPLLTAPTKDGVWLQFAQTEPRLFAAMLEDLGLTPLLADPKWKGLPMLETQELRTELWEIMIGKVGERTLAQWQQVFETNPHINAEIFRDGPEVLGHPQLDHDGRVTVAEDPALGTVRQPSTLVHTDEQPLTPARPAPALDEYDGVPEATPAPAAVTSPAPALPLDGVTILDIGVMFAGPFGATMLADLGARVIKVESLDGDTIRRAFPFPEAGGAKVMQGKESIQLDLTTDEGKAIVHELAKRADIVLCAFRAGAAKRAGIDPETLKALNPRLIYLNAPGYGTGGPFGARPAYAPSIGAASGLALTDAPDAAGATTSLAEIKPAAIRLFQASAVPSLQADGVAALAVASAMLLGLLARARGRALGTLTTTMLASATHALIDRTIDYPGKPAAPTVDDGGHGYHALYRLYEAAEGWVFLAAPAEKEWPELVAALSDEISLDGDPRFATAGARAADDGALAQVLGDVFTKLPATDWEERLTAAGVGCVAVGEQPSEVLLQTDERLVAEYTVAAKSPIFEEHHRLAPAVRFSRSRTRAMGGCLAGDHTDALLSELGYPKEAIEDLRERRVIG
ncbi:CaiB/BaiF CoA transferase family protein [Amycolatopsis sp.]|uniref:CaiB/BaiF CoA transferase family protein n=1 Tax=Amycolatopsis sp. TaxID=37632 RepID=UPI002C991198|nr:CoA transferase [Amycolatopsis sp.]HVV10528.1 CoA transferase [Amycolatopsis sp.]